MSVDVEQPRAPHQTSRLFEHRSLRYLGACFFLPLLAYLFPFFAERSRTLQELSVTSGGSALDYGHQLAGQNADVIIFGDSTSMFGVNTVQMSKELGLKVINIPNTFGSLATTGDWALREYLSANKPPRLIFFQFAPWDLDFHGLRNLAFYEGDEEILRHANLREFSRFFLRQPTEMFLFPFRFYATDTGLTSFQGWGKPRVELVEQGFRPIRGAIPLKPNCSFHQFEIDASGTVSVRDLLQKYTTPVTKTSVYLSPIPACKGYKTIVQRKLKGLDAAPPVVVPPAYINTDFTRAHPLPQYVAYTTELATKAVSQALARP